MIPVLGIPVLNRPDLLAECLRSIDVPVERLVVIDNSGTGELSNAALAVRPDAIVVDPPANLGVAASWNFVIQTAPAAPWWCLANADIRFATGDLERLAAAMADPAPAVRCLLRFGAFGINAACVDAVGWFDENFAPIYAEDCDYEYRLRLAGVPDIDLPSGAIHAEGGSVTYRSDRRYADRNARTYPANLAYYAAKWGGPPRGGERLASPFGRGGPVSEWTLDRRRLAANAWD